MASKRVINARSGAFHTRVHKRGQEVVEKVGFICLVMMRGPRWEEERSKGLFWGGESGAVAQARGLLLLCALYCFPLGNLLAHVLSCEARTQDARRSRWGGLDGPGTG